MSQTQSKQVAELRRRMAVREAEELIGTIKRLAQDLPEASQSPLIHILVGDLKEAATTLQAVVYNHNPETH